MTPLVRGGPHYSNKYSAKLHILKILYQLKIYS